MLLVSVLALVAGLAAAAGRPARVALAAADGASCAPGSGSGSISGAVTAPGGAPLANVQVIAYTLYGDRASYSSTNASGFYEVGSLIAGQYLLEFQPSSDGWAFEWYADQPGPSTAAPVAVSAGADTPGINAELALGARFSGQVSGAGGGPLQYADVNVYDASGRQVAGASTDAAGSYTTSPGLAAGSYRISFGDTGGFLGEFYSDKAALAEADALTVSPPSTLDGVDAVLARGGAISGQVTLAGGGPPPAFAVSAYGAHGYGYTYTDAAGNYAIAGLGSGSYQVTATPLSGSDNLFAPRQAVDVAAPNTTSAVNFTASAGGTLTGMVTDAGGTPLSGITVYIGNQDGSFGDYFSTDASGIYTAIGLPSGSYRVLFRPSSDYIPEAYNDRPDFGQADLVAVTAPNTVSGINAALAKGGAISGTVTDAGTGAPIEDVYVEVLDADGQRVEGTATHADGSYTTAKSLPAGSYRVRFNADERFASCAYITSYYHNQPEGTAELVSVGPPDTTGNVDAELVRGSIVFGKVTDAVSGAPITSGSVQFYGADGTLAGYGRLTFLGGYHSVTGLPSGSYRAQFVDNGLGYVDEFYNNKPSLATATPIMLAAPVDRLGIDAALARGGQIGGRVLAADTGAPFDAGYVVVYSQAGDAVGYSAIEPDGSYLVMDGLASGSYRVAAVPYSGGEQERQRRPAAPWALAQPSLAPSSAGYFTTFYPAAVVPGAATLVPVLAPNGSGAIDITVMRGALLPVARR